MEEETGKVEREFGAHKRAYIYYEEKRERGGETEMQRKRDRESGWGRGRNREFIPLCLGNIRCK